MRRFRITEPMNLQGDPIVSKQVIARTAHQSKTHPKREIRAMTARTAPATIIPILAPDVILTWLSFRRSGRVSMAKIWARSAQRGQESEEDPQKSSGLLWTSQKNAPDPSPLPMRDSKDAMKTAALTGMQQQKCLRVPIVSLLSKSRSFVEGVRVRQKFR